MNVTFEKTKKLINELIDKNNEYLDTESKEAILNYIEHDEYEMAFEGLFIELIKLNLLLSSDDERDMAFELAQKLNLDKNSIFEEQFWEMFMNFIVS